MSKNKLAALGISGLTALSLAGCGSNGPSQATKESQAWAHNFICSQDATSQECEHPAEAKAEEEEYARQHPALSRAHEHEEDREP